MPTVSVPQEIRVVVRIGGKEDSQLFRNRTPPLKAGSTFLTHARKIATRCLWPTCRVTKDRKSDGLRPLFCSAIRVV